MENPPGIDGTSGDELPKMRGPVQQPSQSSSPSQVGGSSQRRSIRQRVSASKRYLGLLPARSLVQSFNYAFEGVIFTLATQRNMRIHYAAASIAMLACVVLGVSRIEFALVMFAAAFVIAAEMVNTAVEAAIDVATTTFNPLAKIAKDLSLIHI